MFNVNKIDEATLIAIDTETCDPNLKTMGPGGFRKDTRKFPRKCPLYFSSESSGSGSVKDFSADGGTLRSSQSVSENI